MSESKIWYVKFPTYRYNQDVKALARKAGLEIIDAQFDDGKGAEKTPKLTLKPEYAEVEPEPEPEPVKEPVK